MSEVSHARLQQEWVLCAIAAAAARFVPVPVVDDLIRSRATRTAVAHTWQARGRPDRPEVIGILVDDSSGLGASLIRSAIRLPLTLMFFPVRKMMRMLTAVRGVSAELVGVVLLARSVDRCLEAGWFTSGDERVLEQQARIVRKAHDKVIGQADLHLLYRAVGAALREVGGLRKQAEAFARRTFGWGAATSLDDVATAAPSITPGEAKVEQGVRQVVAVLDRPEIAQLLTDLDRRFDDALARLGGPAGPRPASRPPVSSPPVSGPPVSGPESAAQ